MPKWNISSHLFIMIQLEIVLSDMVTLFILENAMGIQPKNHFRMDYLKMMQLIY